MLTQEFKDKLKDLLNCYSIDSKLGVPDFILAEHLSNYLELMNDLGKSMDSYYGHDTDMDDADPGEMDGDLESGLASAGYGTDEDYGGTDERY